MEKYQVSHCLQQHEKGQYEQHSSACHQERRLMEAFWIKYIRSMASHFKPV